MNENPIKVATLITALHKDFVRSLKKVEKKLSQGFFFFNEFFIFDLLRNIRKFTYDLRGSQVKIKNKKIYLNEVKGSNVKIDKLFTTMRILYVWFMLVKRKWTNLISYLCVNGGPLIISLLLTI